jgi:hypothetical protein
MRYSGIFIGIICLLFCVTDTVSGLFKSPVYRPSYWLLIVIAALLWSFFQTKLWLLRIFLLAALCEFVFKIAVFYINERHFYVPLHYLLALIWLLIASIEFKHQRELSEAVKAGWTDKP